MKHPMVAIITHPTNRLIPHRRGYDLDYDRIFDAAAETGTLVEIDGAPRTSISTGRSRVAPWLPARPSSSTATATAPTPSAGRWSSASPWRGAAGWKHGTSSMRGRCPRSAPFSRASAASDVRRIAAAFLVGAAAFCLYDATLLPGFDFGDTGSFQTSVASPLITPRDAYPIYFAIGRIALRLAPGGPAHALNLASATQAAVACALVVLLAEELSGSLLGAIAAAIVFAGSYTFWTQAIIAEVYTLHLVFVAPTLLLLLRWQGRPSAARLSAVLRDVCARLRKSPVDGSPLPRVRDLSVPGRAPRGWRSMFAPRIVVLALLFACLGAAQYAWDSMAVLSAPHPPASLTERRPASGSTSPRPTGATRWC